MKSESSGLTRSIQEVKGCLIPFPAAVRSIRHQPPGVLKHSSMFLSSRDGEGSENTEELPFRMLIVYYPRKTLLRLCRCIGQVKNPPLGHAKGQSTTTLHSSDHLTISTNKINVE